MSEFIPKEYKNEQVTIRVSRELIREIDKIATRFNLSRNKFINQCIDYAMAQLIEEATEQRMAFKE
ncbi:MAG: hypothetical protein HFI72_00530 [Peptococcaceae bacterium]|nr:hypothetical protein [Peptococcaceae bacterium]